jgi:hypothetical protein
MPMIEILLTPKDKQCGEFETVVPMNEGGAWLVLMGKKGIVIKDVDGRKLLFLTLTQSPTWWKHFAGIGFTVSGLLNPILQISRMQICSYWQFLGLDSHDEGYRDL